MIELIKDFFTEDIVEKVIIIVITALLTHIAELHKIKKQTKINYREKLGEKIFSAYEEVKKVELKAAAIDIFSFGDDIETPEDATFSNNIYYPEIMESRETFIEFLDGIQNCREEHERYLDLTTSAYLYAMNRYTLCLLLFMNETGETNYEFVGLMLIGDIQKWQKRIDKHITKKINRPSYKMFSEEGIKWRFVRFWVESVFLKRSLLNKIIKAYKNGEIDFLGAENEKNEAEEV